MIPGTFRRAAGQQQHVAVQADAGGALQLRFDVGGDAQAHRDAASLGHCRGQDGGVGIIDRTGADRLARRHDFVAGGQDRDARPAHDIDLRPADGGQHTDFA
jgi:hypothetical protein